MIRLTYHAMTKEPMPVNPQICRNCGGRSMEGHWKIVDKGKFKRWVCSKCQAAINHRTRQ